LRKLHQRQQGLKSPLQEHKAALRRLVEGKGLSKKKWTAPSRFKESMIQ
jgi:hypothetical protein